MFGWKNDFPVTSIVANKPTTISFILASKSPRRKNLLGEAGYQFEVICSKIDESAFAIDGLSSVEHAQQLALAKANDVGGRYPERYVLGADTVVDFEGMIIGKPKDAADAERITRMLFSGPHRVITGVAIVKISAGLELVRVDVTVVYPKKLSESQIAGHIDSGDWRGKAGAYGIQEAGDAFVDKIEGSFTNVIGLPMELVEEMFCGLDCG